MPNMIFIYFNLFPICNNVGSSKTNIYRDVMLLLVEKKLTPTKCHKLFRFLIMNTIEMRENIDNCLMFSSFPLAPFASSKK